MTLPPLPDQPRHYLCTKCGSRECKGDINQEHPACARCGYLGFAAATGYTAEQMQAYGQQCREAALQRADDAYVCVGCGAIYWENNVSCDCEVPALMEFERVRVIRNTGTTITWNTED